MSVAPPALDWLVDRCGPLAGEIGLPGDKSVSHRAIMLAALTDGCSRVDGFLDSADTRATAAAFVAMGVRVEAPAGGVRIVHGVGIDGLAMPHGVLDCGNSGTGMRLLAGLLAGQRFDSTLTGDASLQLRPMRRIITPLEAMGARIEAAPEGRPPLTIHGDTRLSGIDYALPVASAQVKSALLLAALRASGETLVREPRPTRDYTERMLAAFGWPIHFEPGRARLSGGHRLRATDIAVPADFSSAAFFIVAASIVPGSRLLLREVGLNPRRTGLLDVLRMMGADIRVHAPRLLGGEPVADLEVRHAPLRGIDVPGSLVPDMIDEFPILFIAAAAAEGVTRVRGAAELRVKESDRIAVMARGLERLGIAIRELPDGADIRGGKLRGGEVDSAGDHRIAMSFAVAGAIAQAPLRIGDCGNVATSFPGFPQVASTTGMRLAVLSHGGG